MSEQKQFLEVVSRDVAWQRFESAVNLHPIGEESVALSESLGRILSRDVHSRVNVPSFDRSNFDGFAVRAIDTAGATEEKPVKLALLDERLLPSVVPTQPVSTGSASLIATGAMLPRGSDAVVMVEYSDVIGEHVEIRHSVAPGTGVSFAGSDISHRETVLRQGDLLTSRETGVLAAIGETEIEVWQRPKVAVISTGNEIISPEKAMQPGLVYDSNSRVIADAVRELGADPIEMGIVNDDADLLASMLEQALDVADVVLFTGGTSKGEGDLCYQVVKLLDDPGIVAHGVALKPGKPICLAVTSGKPVVVLPGFPTSAIFTFHEFVAPVIRRLQGRSAPRTNLITARLANKVISEVGRTEYLLVRLVETASQRETIADFSAYPMGKGSGSVTTFSQADGFVTIERHQELIDEGEPVQVTMLGRELPIAQLVVIGSHCIGLDFLLSEMQRLGYRSKLITVGSTAGLQAAKDQHCDLAGIHLLDPETNCYNEPFVTDGLELLKGYTRRQGLVYRKDDPSFPLDKPQSMIDRVKLDPTCVMLNRNSGSGTRILIDQLLAGTRPEGYANQAKNHHAIVAAVEQGRADWGIAIEPAVQSDTLAFIPVMEESFDFVIPASRSSMPAVMAFRELLASPTAINALRRLGFGVGSVKSC